MIFAILSEQCRSYAIKERFLVKKENKYKKYIYGKKTSFDVKFFFYSMKFMCDANKKGNEFKSYYCDSAPASVSVFYINTACYYPTSTILKFVF